MWFLIGVISAVIIVCAICNHASLDKRMIQLAQINAGGLDNIFTYVKETNRNTERLRDELNEFKEFITKKLEGRDDVRRIDKEILAHIELIRCVLYSIFEDTKNTWNTLHTHLSNLDFSLEG
ncbi:hypothetical protein ACOSHH_001886 [Klebsiella aerogenes]